jgi:menaquinone-9 beta-reductase
VTRPPRLGGRIGLSWHVTDDPGDPPRDARMVVLPDGAYCGIAPVPGGRVNVGIVLAGSERREDLASRGAAEVGAAVLEQIPPLPGVEEPWRDGEVTDLIAGAMPLGTRASRRSGPGWLLIGDAAGFLDPFTGEGLHRALVSARLAAEVVEARLAGRSRDLGAYDRAMRDRFRTKDAVSVMVQAFLARPAAFEYAARRLAQRRRIRETMGLVMGDLVPASRVLDPRFLAALLAP